MTARTRVLSAMPGTVSQLVTRTKFSRSSVNAYLGLLRKAKAIHISGWERVPTGQSVAVYSVGGGVDAPVAQKADCDSYRAESGLGILPAALMAQSRVFPLAGVWA